MRAEKQFLTQQYTTWLKASPFFLVVDYRGLVVGHFNELRKRLAKAGAQVHVVKNSAFRFAVKEAGVADLGVTLTGQLAVVIGRQDVAVAAKVLKTFRAEFDKPKIQFGYIAQRRLEPDEILVLAGLPPLEVLRGKIVGVVATPATRLVQMLNAPAQQLTRVLQARVDKGV